MTADCVVGKTIERAEFDGGREQLRLFFTDGTMLYADGVWLNTGEAALCVALIEKDQPKSYEESKDFYDYRDAQQWEAS